MVSEHKLSFLVNRPDGSWVATCKCGHESPNFSSHGGAVGAQAEHEDYLAAGSLPLDRETES